MEDVAGLRTLEQAHTYGFELASEHTERFLDYVAALDAAALATRVPGLDWTVGETITHVQSLFERYTTDLRRSPTPRALSAQNAEDVARLGVNVDAAINSVRAHLAFLASAVGQIEPDRRFPFHAGQSVTMAAGWGNLLGELLAHGDDIARATGLPFTVPSADLEILWRFTAPALEGWIRPEAAVLTESWRLRFPFGEIDAVFDRGTLRWDDRDVIEPVYTVEIADAAEFALLVPYRRRPIREPLVALLATRFLDL